MKRVALIIPMRNESENIEPLVRNLDSVIKASKLVRLTYLFVEDTSRDNTLERLKLMANRRDDIHVVSLNKGMGQAAAVVKGIELAESYDAIVMMDGDGSHPPSAVLKMIDEYLSGSDIVQGVRTGIAYRGIIREIGTTMFTWFVYFITGNKLKNQNVYFRLINSRVRELFLNSPNWWRTLRIGYAGLPSNIRVVYLPFEAPTRRVGVSNYTLIKLLLFSLDGVLGLITKKRLWLWVVILNSIFFFYSPKLVLLSLLLSFFLIFRYQGILDGSFVKKVEVSYDSKK